MSEVESTIQETEQERKRRLLCERRRKKYAESQQHRDRIREEHRRYRESHPEKVKEAKRLYGLKNKDKIVAKVKKWVSENKERAKITQRKSCAAWRSRNPLKVKERQKRRYRDNPEKENARLKAYYNTPKGRAVIIASANKRRAKLKNLECSATSEEIVELLTSAKECHYCKRRFVGKLKATLDHVVPVSKDGAHMIENFVAACKSCNSSKHAKPLDQFAKEMGVLFF